MKLRKKWRDLSHELICKKMDEYAKPENQKYVDFYLGEMSDKDLLNLLNALILLSEHIAAKKVREDAIDYLNGWR
jgi:hypothetical protein